MFLLVSFLPGGKRKKKESFSAGKDFSYTNFLLTNKKSKKRKHSDLMALASSCCYLFLVYSFIFIITDHLLVL